MNGIGPPAFFNAPVAAHGMATPTNPVSRAAHALPAAVPRLPQLFSERTRLHLLSTNWIQGELLAAHLGGTFRGDLVEQSWIEQSLPPDVVLIDSSYDPADSVVGRAVRRCRMQRLAVVAFGCSRAPLAAARWVDLGVDAIVHADASLSDLVQMLARVTRGENVLGVGTRESLLSELRMDRAARRDRETLFDGLTKREMEVLRLLARASTPEEIARHSFVSLNTVRTQIRSILAKLTTSSVVGAVALAYSSGWMDADKFPKADGTTPAPKA